MYQVYIWPKQAKKSSSLFVITIVYERANVPPVHRGIHGKSIVEFSVEILYLINRLKCIQLIDHIFGDRFQELSGIITTDSRGQ